jgi:hypothetical protein
MLNKIPIKIKILVAIFLCVIVLCISIKKAINNKAIKPKIIRGINISQSSDTKKLQNINGK